MPRKSAALNKPRVRVLINALHTMGGGGQVYLQGVLPTLAADARLEIHLLVPQRTLGMLQVPAGVVVHVAPIERFGVSHVWEQLALPVLARLWGCKVVLSNANYGPLLAPRASVILHCTPRAAAAAKGAFWWVYWRVLRVLTRVCAWRAPVFFSVAAHIVPDYAGPRTLRRMRLAPPAVAEGAVPAEGLKRDPNLVLAVGDFYPQKNYPLLLQAFAKLREVHKAARLTIIGRPVQEEIRAEVLRLARELKVLEGLTIIPGVPHAHLMKMMAQAGVYVSTSNAEAFNMPVLEAMACGTPVVVLDTPFQHEVAGADAYAGAVFVPASGGDIPAALAIALLGLLSNPELAHTMAGRGLKRAAQYSWAKTGQVLADGLAHLARIR